MLETIPTLATVVNGYNEQRRFYEAQRGRAFRRLLRPPAHSRRVPCSADRMRWMIRARPTLSFKPASQALNSSERSKVFMRHSVSDWIPIRNPERKASGHGVRRLSRHLMQCIRPPWPVHIAGALWLKLLSHFIVLCPVADNGAPGDTSRLVPPKLLDQVRDQVRLHPLGSPILAIGMASSNALQLTHWHPVCPMA